MLVTSTRAKDPPLSTAPGFLRAFKLIALQLIHGSTSERRNTWYNMGSMTFGIGLMTGPGILLDGLLAEHFTQV